MFTTKKFKVGWNISTSVFLWVSVNAAAHDPSRKKAIELLNSTRALTLGSIAGGRLTTESGVPLSTSNRTAQTTLYYTPYIGSKITLYTGTNWQIFEFPELSVAVPAGSAGDMYDVFIYPNSGTPTLELLAWTNSTTRAVGLAYVEGVRVKSGATSRRYLGSFSLSGTGTTEDSETARLVYNLLNQTERLLYKQDTVNAHSYNGSYRLFNNDANSKVEFVIGEQGFVMGNVDVGFTNPGSSTQAYFHYGADSTTSPAGSVSYNTGSYGNRTLPISFPFFDAGRHYIAVLEQTNSSGPATFEYYNLIAALLM